MDYVKCIKVADSWSEDNSRLKTWRLQHRDESTSHERQLEQKQYLLIKRRYRLRNMDDNVHETVADLVRTRAVNLGNRKERSPMESASFPSADWPLPGAV